jgi:hypothetical protein
MVRHGVGASDPDASGHVAFILARGSIHATQRDTHWKSPKHSSGNSARQTLRFPTLHQDAHRSELPVPAPAANVLIRGEVQTGGIGLNISS